ncbi:MAG: Microtubule-associated serine/threonine-protein kinase 2, partial [Paramarteilia canceri]
SSNQGNVSYSLEGNRVSFDNFSSFSFDDEHEQLSQYYDADFKSNNAYFKKEFKNVSKKFERELQKFIKDYSSIYISNPFESIWTTKLVELAKSCLSAIVNDSLNLAFFYEIMDNIENLINEILKKDRRKMNGMNNKISRLSLIISTPCRLMEIIETDAEDIINRLQYLETNNPEQSDNIKKYMTQQTRAPTDFVDKSWQIKSDVTLKKHHSYIDISKVVDIEDFKHVKDLSKGKFGTTTLVQYKDSGLQFAMKKIKKSSYVRKNQVNSLFAERDIQFYLNSIYIANLFGTFVSDDSVYFLMEYVTAGDLGKYMDNNILEDDEILKISAELVLALQFLHSKEIVHRDLKPEKYFLQ